MKKALACTLSLALLFSLTACGKSQTDEPDNSQSDNSAATSTQADVSIPEPDNTPAPEPPKAPVPEQLSDTIPAAPAENEDPQDQSEPAAQEPAETEPVKTETPKQTAPKTTDNLPAETTPAEPTQEQQPAEQTQQQEQQPAEQTQQQEQQAQSGLTPEMEEHNRQMQLGDSYTSPGGYQFTPGQMTLEDAQKAGEKSGAIYQGQEKLQQAADGTFYYYY